MAGLLERLPWSIVLVERLPKAGSLCCQTGDLTLQPGDGLVAWSGQQLVSGGGVKAVLTHPPLRLGLHFLKGAGWLLFFFFFFVVILIMSKTISF